VNHSPSFATDSDLDFDIKKAVITEALLLVNINDQKKKKEVLAETKKMIRQRSLSSKVVKISKEEKNSRICEEKIKRDLHEEKHCQGFIKLYPGNNDGYYEKFFKAAESMYFKLSMPKRAGSRIKPQENDEEEEDRSGEVFNDVSGMLAKRRAAWV